MKKGILVALALTLSALSACDPTLDAATKGCTSTSQCARGEICRTTVGMCAKLNPGTVGGGFSCKVVEQPTANDFGPGDVVVNYDGRDVALWAGTVCQIDPTSGQVTIRMNAAPIGGLGDESLLSATISFPTSAAVPSGRVSVPPPGEGWYGDIYAHLERVDLAGPRPLAALEIGVTMSGALTAGGKLTGYIEGAVREAAVTVTVGRGCANVVECGPDIHMFCGSPFEGGNPQCWSVCSGLGQATCESYGGACIDGACLNQCIESCPKGTTCEKYDDKIKVCF